jgi:hypothetical protein
VDHRQLWKGKCNGKGNSVNSTFFKNGQTALADRGLVASDLQRESCKCRLNPDRRGGDISLGLQQLCHSTISVDPKAGPRTAVNNLLAGSNGSTVKAFGQYYYRIEQFQADNVTKVDIASPNTPIWQYSTQDPSEAEQQ